MDPASLKSPASAGGFFVPPGDTGHSVLKPGPSEQTKSVRHPVLTVPVFLGIKITIDGIY